MNPKLIAVLSLAAGVVLGGIVWLDSSSSKETCCEVPDAATASDVGPATFVENGIEYAVYQSACMANLPGGSEVNNLVVTTQSGHRIYLSRCDGGLGPGPAALRKGLPEQPGDYGPGQMDYLIGLVNPYDGGAVLFNEAGIDAAISGLTLWPPFYDAGFYPHFMQLTGWFVLPSGPADSTRNELWPSLQFNTAGPPNGYGSSGSINGGSNVLQPIATYVPGSGWSLSLVWCCDASNFGTSVPGLSYGNPGDIVSFEIMVDSRYPCPNNGLGCHYLMGANLGATPNFNFQDRYLSIYIDPCEGPAYSAGYALEQNLGGNSCPGSMPSGDASVFHVETLYEAADQNITPGIRTLPIVAPFPPAADSNLTPNPWITGYGYPVTGGLNSQGNTILPPGTGLDITRAVGVCQAGIWSCPTPCDAGAIGNSWFVSWE